MAKCGNCGATLGLLSFASYCGDCKQAIEEAWGKEQAERQRALAKAELERQEELERERKARAVELAKGMKRRLLAGEPVYMHDPVYRPRGEDGPDGVAAVRRAPRGLQTARARPARHLQKGVMVLVCVPVYAKSHRMMQDGQGRLVAVGVQLLRRKRP